MPAQRFYFIFAILIFAGGVLGAQQTAWQPSPGHTQTPIWPGAGPDAQPVSGPELSTTDPKELIGGKTVTAVSNVTRPTMTVYAPQGRNTGGAVVVFPQEGN